MKTTLILMLVCFLASCTTPSRSLVIESDTGRAYDASHLDALRGMASGKRDDEQMSFARAIIAKAGIREVDDSGTVYPGTVKVIRWEYRGQKKYTALRLATWPHVHDALPCWQGPNPSSGFYGGKLETTYLP